MKILKLLGWALLSLFVLFLLLIIIVAVFDFTTDDMEVKAVKRTTQPLTESCLSLYCGYFGKDRDIVSESLQAFLSKAVDADLVLLQNTEEAYRDQINSLFQSHNAYFSFSKRSLVSLASNGTVSFMDFSGLYALSVYAPLQVRKLLLPTETNWFNSLLSPIPSIQILEFESDGKQLYLMNLDNELNTQWESEDINIMRLEYIKQSVIETLARDAYFLIAGNWQNVLPGQLDSKEKANALQIPLNWTKKGWQWVYPPNEKTGYGVLASGNVQIKEIDFIKNPSDTITQALSLRFCLE